MNKKNLLPSVNLVILNRIPKDYFSAKWFRGRVGRHEINPIKYSLKKF